MQLEGPFRLAALHFSHASPGSETRDLLRPYMDLVLVMGTPLTMEALELAATQHTTHPNAHPPLAIGQQPLDLPRWLHVAGYQWSWLHTLRPDTDEHCSPHVVRDVLTATVTDVRGARYRCASSEPLKDS